MFKRGFLNGLLTGSVLGALASLFIQPEKKQQLMESPTVKRLRGKSRQVEEKAKEVMNDVFDGVSGLWRK